MLIPLLSIISKNMIMKEYNVKNIIDDSYQYGIGHIPSALSLFCITRKLLGYSNPLVIGKSFGVQAWFLDDVVRRNFLSQTERKILTVDDFKNSSFNVKYCQQQLGLAAGYSVGYSFTHLNELVFCILSDGDAMMKSTLDAIDLAFKYNLNIKFLIDYNKVQLFGERDCTNYFRTVLVSYDEINTTFQPEIILFHTRKGAGISLLEQEPKRWHYTVLNENQYKFLSKLAK